jgi:hypothetical protein
LLLSIEEYQNVGSNRCVEKRREVRRELVRCMKDAKDWVLVPFKTRWSGSKRKTFAPDYFQENIRYDLKCSYTSEPFTCKVTGNERRKFNTASVDSAGVG